MNLKFCFSEDFQKRGLRGKLEALRWPSSEDETEKRVQTLHRLNNLFSSSLVADAL